MRKALNMRPLKLTVEAFGPFAGKEIIDFTLMEDQQLFGIYGELVQGNPLYLKQLLLHYLVKV